MSGGTPGPGAEPGAVGELAEPGVGHRIGSYRIIRLIGTGATGRVFEVEHLTIGRRAAMKILAPEHAGRPGAIRRLFTEARAISQISHPHIVEVTDLVDGDGLGRVNAIVMELLQGQSLAQAIQHDKVMAPARFLPILAQVADALAAAHANRFVHRDLKPENVYLSAQHGYPDYVKLLDFGLVKVVSETHARATAEGIFVGTPAYASPEQASGKPVDHRTDIYSLGVILYELLCGHLPFDGRNFGEFLVKHLTAEPPPTPPEVLRTELGRALDGIARRCLAKDPVQRFGSAAELRELFEGLAAGRDLPLVSALRARERRPYLIAGAAGLVAFAGMMLLRAGGRRALPSPIAAPAVHTPRVEPLLPARTVALSFTSVPPGAETRIVGEPLLLGQTPFLLTERATGAELVYEMRLPGYAPRRDRVVLTADPPQKIVGGPLKKLAPAPRTSARAPKKKPGKKPGRNSTLNPFSR
jgi:tRNA A-37 threonylcarbamoyl transferase component Bud32